ncbi:glycosyltransferase [Endozoicomonas montiporae]|uniref:Glycosyltransferase n=1 Tax=Endozoicomonas montiporae CL-33 TaxID=570277 RepID=A0A142BDK6_9GAMM|nr:glycosyltransferase [Endozoicomonas montiporae]AMO56832.1 glycosyltransferase [Endozoicomonas montiporae CL-33]
MMNILVLCNYPIKNPLHGGQLRVHNIVKTYKAAGYNVDVAGVLGNDHYPEEQGFLEFPGFDLLRNVVEDIRYMEDYATNQLFLSDNAWYDKLLAKIRVNPDIIHLEQPWLYSFLKRYIEEKKIHTKIIYGSQNIEYKLKEEIIETFLGKSTAKKAASLVRCLEQEVINNVDGVICVSKNDLQWMRKQTDKPTILAQNGVSDRVVSVDSIAQAREATQGKKYAIFCGSAHLPNITGFYKIFGDGFGSLNPEEALVVVGNVGPAVMADERLAKSANLKERLLITGEVDEPLLCSLVELSHCCVLPITQGGGTNLKTAEALLSGKYIISTSVAMRGFEDFIGDEGVFIADGPADFKKALRHIMNLKPFVLSEKAKSKRQRVLWKNCLKNLPILAKNILTK